QQRRAVRERFTPLPGARPIVALLAALVGALGALGAVWLQNWNQSRSSEADARECAYIDLLVSSLAMARRARSLIATLQVRTGISEGLAVTFGQRQQMDPMTLHEWLEEDVAAVMEAWTRAWATATPAGVAAASNRVMTCCGDVFGVLDLSAPATMLGRLRETLAGVDTEILQSRYQEKLATLAHARRDLALLVRAETGRAPAELFEAE
ncbi:hypothetical protein, partial [uncultured Jatrophihabitans sp.]|uniref:hypothetical protein n=1 Tax=uncultured Jatrophihabitans sp. TaxID=1610747 RepID=UPI0035C9F06B